MSIPRTCLAAAACMALVACAGAAAAARDDSQAEILPRHVLMVGNSHTARNGGLDWLVENFVAAESAPRTFDAEAMTKGGVTLAYHWQNGVPDRIRSGEFDTVVLQGWLSGEESQSLEPFLEHARLLDGVIRDAGAETVFFMTWPRTAGDWSDLDDAIEVHRILSSELDAQVAPAALAFELAQAERPDIQLIAEDQTHATWEGAYLAAATVYATLFGSSPEGLDFHFWVDPDDAAFLQRIAWEAVTQWRSLIAADTSVAVAD